MAEPGGAHLSIGEVLGLLLEEFPDVTISKIRFLESQGLIEPERTPSGYRKFFDDDVELLRVILREQRENFLPLRVIKDRIDSGEIETGDRHADRAAPTRRRPPSAPTPTGAADATDAGRIAATPAGRAAEPRGRRRPRRRAGRRADRRPVRRHRRRRAAPAATEPAPRPAARLLPGVLVNRDELCAMASVTPRPARPARGVRRGRPSAAAPATCTATTPSRSPRPPAGSCGPASTPATCGPGARRSSARPGCTSS